MKRFDWELVQNIWLGEQSPFWDARNGGADDRTVPAMNKAGLKLWLQQNLLSGALEKEFGNLDHVRFAGFSAGAVAAEMLGMLY